MTSSRGHVLLMVLALLALSAAVLARVCHDGISASLAAGREARELQRRWAMNSCRSTFLPAAGAIVARRDLPGRPAVLSPVRITLGGQTFAVLLGDEQAKASLNAIYQRHGSAQVQKHARAAARTTSDRVVIHLRPASYHGPANAPDAALLPVFHSWGEVFEESSVPDPRLLASMGANLTCFGNGKLNWKRASPAALEAVLSGHAALVRQIISRRAAGPEASLPSIVSALGLPEQTQRELKDLLTDSSESYSLWIWPQDGAAAEAQLAVREMSDGRTQTRCFTWMP